MRALLLLASLLLTTVACGRESAASGTPAGRLEPRGQLAFSCGADCSYIGDAVHVGEGCVAGVRGRTRLVLSTDYGDFESTPWRRDDVIEALDRLNERVRSR